MAVKPVCRRTNRRTQEWLLYTGVGAILIGGKFPNIIPQLLQEALSMEQECCGTSQLSIQPQKVQYLDQYLIEPCYLDIISQQDTEIFQSVGLLIA